MPFCPSGSGSSTTTAVIDIIRYTPAESREWNAFVAGARNGHFIFDRRYMDYHNERFSDFSVMIRAGGRLVGVMPANIDGNVMISHAGLTFGGLIVGERLRTVGVLAALQGVLAFARDHGCGTLIYRAVPHIYHRRPAEDDLYALFRLRATLTGRKVSSAIDLENPSMVSDFRRRRTRKARRAAIVIADSTDYGRYMTMVRERLLEKYQREPTHSSDEIALLAQRFPQEIRLVVAERDGELLAGALVYETDCVAHTQYLATTETGRELSALDLVVDTLIRRYSSKKRFLDLGTSTEQDGRVLNEGLVFQKESYGARAVVYDTYELRA
jgi:hypothetical protein